MRTEKSVSMGIFRIVNYILITAMVAQFNLFVAEDAYLRLCITVHMHQDILARGNFWRPRIQFLTPINHTFSNLSIRTAISPEDFFLKFDLRIQKTAFVWAHLNLSNLKKRTLFNSFYTIDDQSQHKSHTKYKMDTTGFGEVFHGIFDHSGMNNRGLNVFYAYVLHIFLIIFYKGTFTIAE